MKKNVPTYDFLKKLHSPLSIEYSRLEKAYNSYDASQAHRHDYFELIIFEKSGGMHEIDFVSYPIKKDAIHFISPGQVHLLRRKNNVTGHVIAFKEDAVVPVSFGGNDYIIPSFPIPVLNISSKKFASIQRNLSNLIDEFNAQNAYSTQTLSAYLMLILVEIRRQFESGHNIQRNKINSLINNFRKMVDTYISSIHSVSAYAKMLHVTPGHLNDTVKDNTGISAGELISERLLLEARRLLYHSDLTVKEIAAKLHFDDAAYFSRFFKKNTGVTPLEFREEIRLKYSKAN